MPECIKTGGINDFSQCAVATTGCKVEHTAEEEVIWLRKVVASYEDALNSVFKDEPMKEHNQFFHFVWCNGGRNYPIATEGKLCNCKNYAFVQRLLKQGGDKVKELDKDYTDMLMLLVEWERKTSNWSFKRTGVDTLKLIIDGWKDKDE